MNSQDQEAAIFWWSGKIREISLTTIGHSFVYTCSQNTMDWAFYEHSDMFIKYEHTEYVVCHNPVEKKVD